MAAEGTLNASAAIQRPMLRCHSLGLWVSGDQLQTKLFKFRGLTDPSDQNNTTTHYYPKYQI